MYSSQTDLIRRLVLEGVIKSKQVGKALQHVDRKNYVSYNPYYDAPQSVGYGATISAPHMHAYALQYLQDYLKTAKNVLDVGSGTGYLTAAMCFLTPSECKVYGIQHVPELVQKSIKNIQNDHPQLLTSNKLIIKQGDGRKGWQQNQSIKFQAIHVGAASQDIPQKLLQQLAQGGRMLIPLGGKYDFQQFMAIDKQKGGKIKKNNISVVRYVPLTDLNKQLNQF